MVFEALKARLFGEPTPRDDSLIAERFWSLHRKHILMCLVDTLGSVTHSQLEAVAQVLYGDVKLNRLRPLSVVCQEIELPARGKRRILRNPVLQRTALSYSAEEMEVAYSPIATDPEDPPSEVDAIAGSGPARPLIKGLYGLVSCMQILVKENLGNHQVFSTSAGGRAHADVIRSTYERTDFRRYGAPLVVIHGKDRPILDALA